MDFEGRRLAAELAEQTPGGRARPDTALCCLSDGTRCPMSEGQALEPRVLALGPLAGYSWHQLAAARPTMWLCRAVCPVFAPVPMVAALPAGL